ncbi:endocuticle structural glycoprotein ABD-4-like [Lycorma delicatula]|uniref:endocuticle structural glycoprotein ABD-4-like n=1 Tax=Lycorma delicatula TaxID=130591 RepID=UPI003F519C9E
MYSLRFFTLISVIGCALSRPQQQYTTPIAILAQDSINNGDGSYKYSYDTANSIHADETGYVKNLGVPEQEIQTAQGSFSYKDDQNNQYYITYTADENGFQPQGAHIPTPPPIPDAILRALEYLKTLPQQDFDDKGFPVGPARG